MTRPIPGCRLNLLQPNRLVSRQIKSLGDYKQFMGNTQQGLASDILVGAMLEIALSAGCLRAPLVASQDLGVDE
jgi:hypothetical protein